MGLNRLRILSYASLAVGLAGLAVAKLGGPVALGAPVSFAGFLGWLVLNHFASRPSAPPPPPLPRQDYAALRQQLADAANPREDPRRREVVDLRVLITVDPAQPQGYVVDIMNAGPGDYLDLVLDDRAVLHAIRPGDYDFMREPRYHYDEPEPIRIERLASGEHVRIARKGWSAQSSYDGPKSDRLSLSYRQDGQVVTEQDGRWCIVRIELPCKS